MAEAEDPVDEDEEEEERARARCRHKRREERGLTCRGQLGCPPMMGGRADAELRAPTRAPARQPLASEPPRKEPAVMPPGPRHDPMRTRARLQPAHRPPP